LALTLCAEKNRNHFNAEDAEDAEDADPSRNDQGFFF